MNRIAGIETEYGCLVSDETGQGNADSWPIRIKNHLFKKMKLGAIDLHYRDYEEPPGNGGFLLNGGRLYVDMGHLEYASPECNTLRDMVAYDVAGDTLVQQAVKALGAQKRVAFIKNNVDHETGATFGCHENYLMRRDIAFTSETLGALLSFLATRQIFSGAGRVGQTNPLSFELETPSNQSVDFQLSQRADHIVNDIYQWVQFNRAIINARDEPLADHRLYRRLHLLVGDSNMSPFATALKIGTTSMVLTLLEKGWAPREVVLNDAVTATRQISHTGTGRGAVLMADGRTRDALDIQYAFLAQARKHLGGADEESDWVLDNWQFVLEAIEALDAHPELLIGGVDWISKRWLLNLFRESENLSWSDPWLRSLDLEYHNIDPEAGLFFSLKPGKRIAEWNAAARWPVALQLPPTTTRAYGRGLAIDHLIAHPRLSYVINWDSLIVEEEAPLAMADPFDSYERKIKSLLAPYGGDGL
ncbi:MAG TPA: proteasome accessory factor PafA2 family protein [Chthoniobacteraceae bacterium]|nr:proteasome accessory factor PafA2 family protein [Chthoniobacteraceae bacterium]